MPQITHENSTFKTHLILPNPPPTVKQTSKQAKPKPKPKPKAKAKIIIQQANPYIPYGKQQNPHLSPFHECNDNQTPTPEHSRNRTSHPRRSIIHQRDHQQRKSPLQPSARHHLLLHTQPGRNPEFLERRRQA